MYHKDLMQTLSATRICVQALYQCQCQGQRIGNSNGYGNGKRLLQGKILSRLVCKVVRFDNMISAPSIRKEWRPMHAALPENKY